MAMKKILLFIVIVLPMSIFAQVKLTSSPFKHLPLPQKDGLLKMALKINNTIVAYRFVLPFASYSVSTKQIATGLGYGYNKLHYIDSTQKYYTDLSVFAAIYINGNITPTPYNFTSVGIGVGFLNNLIVISPTFNLPNAEKKGGAFDLKISFGMPLN